MLNLRYLIEEYESIKSKLSKYDEEYCHKVPTPYIQGLHQPFNYEKFWDNSNNFNNKHNEDILKLK